MKKAIYVIQEGDDGLGHQLHGLFTVMSLHGIRNIVFAANIYLEKPTQVQTHLKVGKEHNDWSVSYLKQAVRLFLTEHPDAVGPTTAPIVRGKLETLHSSQETVYALDNAYYFERLKLSSKEALIHARNLASFKRYFTTLNQFLPPRDLPTPCTVVHIRMGDAMTTSRGQSILRLNAQLRLVITKLRRKFPGHTVVVHTDSSDQITAITKGFDIEVRDEKTPVQRVLSDLVHAEVLVCGDSSLSKVCCWLGGENRKLLVAPDNNRHTLPKGHRLVGRI